MPVRRLVTLACASALMAAIATPAATAGPLRTGFVDPGAFSRERQQQRAFDRSRAAGSSVVRLILFWNEVAPERRPASFVATNPNDPAYNWASFDRQVELARSHGLEPIVTIVTAPRWAAGSGGRRPGTLRPDPVEFGKFARAAAARYSGRADRLPRVRYWMAWNEPNRDYFFMPQYRNGRIVSATRYRAMVNRMSRSVRAAHGSNVVVAGGLAPLGRRGKPAPLAFMRSMLCVSRTLGRSCDLRSNPVRFGVWSHHPYTSGGPTRSAPGADDVSLGDLPKMRRLLRAAIRLGHVRSPRPVGFWVTEFAWDSNPPDPRALPARLHARWTAEALYRMWRNGVSVVTWFKLRDDPLRATPYQSGLWTVGGKRKRSFTAFRFPTVAFAKRQGIQVWGRTPTSTSGTVVVELKVGRIWRRLGTVRANGAGIFRRTYRTPYRRGNVRARFQRDASLPFSLTPVRDRYVNPFGCGGAIRC